MKITKKFLDDQRANQLLTGLVSFTEKHNINNDAAYEVGYIFVKGSDHYNTFLDENKGFKPVIETSVKDCNIFYLKLYILKNSKASGITPHTDSHLMNCVGKLNLDVTQFSSKPNEIFIYYLSKNLVGGDLEIEINETIETIKIDDNMILSFRGDLVHGVTHISSCEYRVAIIIETSTCNESYLQREDVIKSLEYFNIWEIKKNSRDVADVHCHTVQRVGSLQECAEKYGIDSMSQCWSGAKSFRTSPVVLYSKANKNVC